jgi:hypothetical protein
MPIDYVNTAPWNDPANPWAAYSEITFTMLGGGAGGADFTTVFTVSTFDPFQDTTNYGGFSANIIYVDLAAMAIGTENTLLFQIKPRDFGAGTIQNHWQVNVLLPATRIRAHVANAPRSVPVKYAGSAQGWVAESAFGYGLTVNDIVITPVLTAVAPWEQRRKRLLEIV